MKADPKTGDLTLASGSILSSRLSRSGFLASPEGRGAKLVVRNDPWCSFRFDEIEESMAIVVYFNQEELESVELSISDPKFGNAWNDWSEAKELQRNKANADWLDGKGLVPGTAYSWGTIWSDYDPKSGSSAISIRYQDGGK
jgi:hypothetical protein